jgi:PKD repeat protein
MTAPGVGEIILTVDPVQINNVITASAAFTEPYPDRAIWDWGDGSPLDTVDLRTMSDSTARGSHTYTKPGIYIVRVTVYDLAGNEYASIASHYVVIYDPAGGFVTGGGWITSPTGAYYADPSLTGKATFGFVSKYLKGTNVPTGNTEFQFSVADLNFKSTSYDWLVVSGRKAQYKGTGTINGAGNYKFMLSAIDGNLNGGDGLDKFRIKIWDAATGAVIYDNQLGVAEDNDPTTTIGGGSIIIHK